MVLKVKAMKTINRMFWAIAAAVVAVACAKETQMSPVQESDGLVPMTFSASAEGEIQTKTTYSGRKVYWEAEDEISVFSIGTQVVKTGFKATEVAEDGTWASFSGVAAPGAETYVAVYPHQDANAFDLATQTLTVNIPTEQAGVANGFASGANVSVALSMATPAPAAEGEEAQTEFLKFRNVGAMFCFKFETADDAAATKSVTFKAKKSETEFWGLTGTASVTYDAQTGLPVATEGSVDHVTLVAPEGGFKAGPVYYLPVYPVGACTGLEVTFTDVNDVTYVKNNDLDAELKRNCLLNIGAIHDPLASIPDELTVKINFYNDEIKWPFTSWVAVADQSVDGDHFIYKHTYEHNGVQVTKDLEFVISKGADAGASYNYNTFTQLEGGKKVLIFLGGTNSWVKLPGIPGMYLKSVSMSTGNKGVKKRFRLQAGTDVNAAAYYNSPLVAAEDYTKPATSTITFPTTDTTMGPLKNTQEGNSYVMMFTKGGSWTPVNMRVFDITVVYTKNKPE